MKLVTWNVNSLRARLPRVLEFLELHQPDVLCMQETKVTPAQYPHGELERAGYVSAELSGGRWAGVAIATRSPLEPREVARTLPGEHDDSEARWIEADVGDLRVVSVYVINGRSLDDPMFRAKLSFLEAMRERITELRDRRLVVMGDFNIAPEDLDVWEPKAFVGVTHVSEDERSRLRAILDLGLVDAYRHLEPETVQHTWWDYRQGHFHRGRGMRIDLALVSKDAASGLTRCGIDRNFRKGPKPSDHAPLILELDA